VAVHEHDLQQIHASVRRRTVAPGPTHRLFECGRTERSDDHDIDRLEGRDQARYAVSAGSPERPLSAAQKRGPISTGAMGVRFRPALTVSSCWPGIVNGWTISRTVHGTRARLPDRRRQWLGPVVNRKQQASRRRRWSAPSAVGPSAVPPRLVHTASACTESPVSRDARRSRVSAAQPGRPLGRGGAARGRPPHRQPRPMVGRK
jgi:hypothetical protein